jgi:hypothetical protein
MIAAPNFLASRNAFTPLSTSLTLATTRFATLLPSAFFPALIRPSQPENRHKPLPIVGAQPPGHKKTFHVAPFHGTFPMEGGRRKWRKIARNDRLLPLTSEGEDFLGHPPHLTAPGCRAQPWLRACAGPFCEGVRVWREAAVWSGRQNALGLSRAFELSPPGLPALPLPTALLLPMLYGRSVRVDEWRSGLWWADGRRVGAYRAAGRFEGPSGGPGGRLAKRRGCNISGVYSFRANMPLAPPIGGLYLPCVETF